MTVAALAGHYGRSVRTIQRAAAAAGVRPIGRSPTARLTSADVLKIRQAMRRPNKPEPPHKIHTSRGVIALETLPSRLQEALVVYDRLRHRHDPETADRNAAAHRDSELQRLRRGLARLTYRSVCKIATSHSHVCPVYVRQHFSTLTTLMGLFWWDDGGSTVRERLLRLAWAKGGRP